MIKLVIIADDFTGALDTGVQFAKQDIPTLVTSDMGFSFGSVDDSIQVLAINAESRHDTPETAYDNVAAITKKAMAHRAEYIYKKTDSALRGNIGAELSAVLDKTNAEQLSFLPAYPNMNRITAGGRQYTDGIPVNESVFGEDPFSPVKTAVIEDIIHTQSGVPVMNVPAGGNAGDFSGICVYDAASNEDLQRIGIELKNARRLKAVAGCAGFAAFLPGLLGLKAMKQQKAPAGRSILFVSGSVNDITIKQTDHARSVGMPVFTINEDMLMCGEPESMDAAGFVQSVREAMEREGAAVIEAAGDRAWLKAVMRTAKADSAAFEQRRSRIKKNMGYLTANILDEVRADTLAVFGGDTLAGVMDALKCGGIVPVAEITDGVVYGRAEGRDLNIVTKSGGFGAENCIEIITEYFKRS